MYNILISILKFYRHRSYVASLASSLRAFMSKSAVMLQISLKNFILDFLLRCDLVPLFSAKVPVSTVKYTHAQKPLL